MSQISPDRQERGALRAELRRRRARIDPAAAQRASQRGAELLAGTPEFLAARRVAGYVAVNGELDPAPALANAIAAGKEVVLPCVTDGGSLRFLPWEPATPMRSNRYGIPEPDPDHAASVPPGSIDLVIVPLVGFDSRGTRLGTGAGYYDRSFEFKRNAPDGRPRLAGFAYAMQRCSALAAAAWDVPLDLLVTEEGVVRFDSVSSRRS